MVTKAENALAQWSAIDLRCGKLSYGPGEDFSSKELVFSIFPAGVRVRPNKTKPASIIWRGNNPRTGDRTAVTVGSVASIAPGHVFVEVERIQDRQRRGLDVRGSTLTVAEAFDDRYLPHIQQALASWTDHLSRFNRHIRRAIGYRSIHQVRLDELIRLVDQLQPAPGSSRSPEQLAPSTVNRVIDLLKAFFSFLVRVGEIEFSPAARLTKRREMNARQRVLSVEEMARLGRALLDAPLLISALVRLALATGMRLGEMLGAEFSDVDFENATLLLRKTKSGKSRLVAVPPEGMAVIKELLLHRQNEFLFPSATGQGHMSRPSKAFAKLLASASITGLTIHDLRRVHGSIAIQGDGVAVLDVSRHLGHGSIAVTERSYLVACDQRLRHAATVASQEINRRLSLRLVVPVCLSVVITPEISFVFAGSMRLPAATKPLPSVVNLMKGGPSL